VVLPAGPITWAPGFGPGGIVAGVQTPPTTTTPVATTPEATTGGVQGAQNLPSTSTESENNVLVLLGFALSMIGAMLLARSVLSTSETKA
jgi:LPXTG-motif cell wall-anchored protein